MNILIVADSIYPDTMGGSHRYVYDLSFALVKLGHSVRVIIPTRYLNLPLATVIDGVEIYRYRRNLSNKIADYRSFESGAERIAQEVCRNWKPDILHGHWPLPTLGVVKALPKATPLIYTFHGPWPEEYLLESNYPIIVKKIMKLVMQRKEIEVLRCAKLILTASEFMANYLVKTYKLERRMIKVVPLGINTKSYEKARKMPKDKARAQLNLPRDKKIILSVRRLRRRMGLDLLIKAFKLVVKKHPDTQLLIAGQGPIREELERLSRRLQINNSVKFLGFVEEDLLPLYYRAADLTVVPSVALEGFGLTILESVATGTPVVGTPVGGIPETLYNFSTCRITKLPTVHSIAQMIIEIIYSHLKEENLNKAFDRIYQAKQVERIYRIFAK